MNVLSTHQFKPDRLRAVQNPRTREERKENDVLRAERTHIVRVWSENACMDEQTEEGFACEMPEIGEEWDDCSGDAISAETGDIELTLHELLSKAGNTRCHNQTIFKYFKWAKQSGQLLELCRGCFSDSCRRGFVSGRCGEGAFHSGNSAAGMLGEDDKVFIEVLQEHGKGLMIFGGLTVGAMVVMCAVVILVLWFTNRKQRTVFVTQRDIDKDGDAEMKRPLIGKNGRADGDAESYEEEEKDEEEMDRDRGRGRDEDELALGMDSLSISTMKEESVSMI